MRKGKKIGKNRENKVTLRFPNYAPGAPFFCEPTEGFPSLNSNNLFELQEKVGSQTEYFQMFLIL